METVIIVIHLMVVVALIGVILVQRSEGGALGIGGGGGGGLFTARGQANILTRATTILAVVFFVTTIALSLIARQQSAGPSILDEIQGPAGGTGPSVPLGNATRGTGEGILDQLPTSPALQGGPQVPTDQGGDPTVPRPGGGTSGPSVPVE